MLTQINEKIGQKPYSLFESDEVHRATQIGNDHTI